jgi:2-isopropylmalate synthase
MSGGDGPIDAIFLAIRDLTGKDISIKEFTAHSVTMGEDAQGGVTVYINFNGDTFRGHGVSTDTIEASTIAILNAVNRLPE